MDEKLLAFFAMILLFTAIGFGFGFILKSWTISRKKNNLEEKLSQMRIDTQNEIAAAQEKANTEAQQVRTEARKEADKYHEEIARRENRLQERESALDVRQGTIDQAELSQRQKVTEIEQQRTQLQLQQSQVDTQLEEVSGISAEEAKTLLLDKIEKESHKALFSRTNKLEDKNNQTINQLAQSIVVSAVQRYGNTVDNDIMSTYVNIGDDEVKGKIIGKEGRNIKAFEKYSGVQLLIDETPGQITISSFDPIRRAVAKTALDNLISDGRIQPARIEEIIEDAKQSVNDIITQQGKHAVSECEIQDLPDELIEILGRLYFRYSFGQNVLQHSIEMVHIAKIIATEVGADIEVTKKAALLHDIGKAVDHEVDGSHVEIGRRMLQKFGIEESVIKAMQAHHEEYPYETIESRIVQTADAISSARPGARSDSADVYIQKLEGLERIAKTIEGVQDAYAVSAGREMRIFVDPTQVNDFQASKIAKKVAKQVESEVKYPGEIKVIVIREKRTIEFAR